MGVAAFFAFIGDAAWFLTLYVGLASLAALAFADFTAGIMQTGSVVQMLPPTDQELEPKLLRIKNHRENW